MLLFHFQKKRQTDAVATVPLPVETVTGAVATVTLPVGTMALAGVVVFLV